MTEKSLIFADQGVEVKLTANQREALDADLAKPEGVARCRAPTLKETRKRPASAWPSLPTSAKRDHGRCSEEFRA